jgi:SH3 domain protein
MAYATIRFVGLFLLCGAALAQTNTAYVTDILRLGLYDNPEASGRPLQTLVSGTKLTILNRVPNFAHVETPDGHEGWVKSAFLVSDKPAQLRVSEMQAQLDKLQAQVQDLTAAKQQAERKAERLSRQMADSTDAKAAVQETLGRLKRENDAYATRLNSYRHSLPLPWVLAALAIALLGGFTAGLWWLDARIRKRHGGFRVY